jgi:site-specific recombinase XerD
LFAVAAPVDSGQKTILTSSGENDKFLTKQQVKHLFQVIESRRDRAIFRILYWCGLRASEVGMLQLSSYDPIEHRLFVKRLKGSLASNAELSRDCVRSVNAWLAERGREAGPLFSSNRRRGISRQQLHELMRKYCALANIPRARSHCHVLKHSLATHLLQAGVDLFTVKKILGHKRITSTEQYLHMADIQVDSVRRRFEEEW